MGDRNLGIFLLRLMWRTLIPSGINWLRSCELTILQTTR